MNQIQIPDRVCPNKQPRACNFELRSSTWCCTACTRQVHPHDPAYSALDKALTEPLDVTPHQARLREITETALARR